MQVVMPLDLGLRIDANDSVSMLIEVTEGMDYSELTGTYQRQPRKSEAKPKQMFQIVMLRFIKGKFATCKIESACQNDIRFMYLLLDDFYAWIDLLNAVPKTGIGKAAHYTLEQRKYLKRYLLDGCLEISNNRAERSIKPFVIDNKNFLFANTPRGAKASAVIFSLIETAKECGFDPFAYLTYIFKNAPNWDIRNDPNALERLLPYAVSAYCKARV